MGKKSVNSAVSVSSIEYDTEYSGTPLQRRTDLAHQYIPRVYESSEIGGSYASSIYEVNHVRTDSDIPMADMIANHGYQNDTQEPPGYQETAMLHPHQGTGDYHPPTNPFRDPEKSKTALRRYFNPLNSLVHLLALMTTIPVLWLNFSNVYWADEDNWKEKWFLFNLNQQDTFNALQFAAKLHEIFVAASVSAMTMHVVRRKLIGKSGLPFGLVVGAYQIGSAEYFKSKSFTVPLFKSIARSQWNVVFVAVLVGVSVVYVNMIGPASAALLIPTLDWYPVKDPFNGLPLTTYFQPLGLDIITDSGLYPQLFKVSDKPEKNCTNPSLDIFSQICPGGGYDQLDNWFNSWALSGLQYDPLMDVFLGKMKRQIVSRIAGDSETEPGIAVASTINNQIALVLDLFSQYIGTNTIGTVNHVKRPRYVVSDGTPVSSPVVQVQCRGVDQRTALENLQRGLNLSFSTSLMENFSHEHNAYQSKVWQVPTNLWIDADAATDEVTFTWIPASVIQDMDNNVGTIDASIAALARVPVAFDVTYRNKTITQRQESLLVSCMFDARWITTAVSYDPKQDSTANFNLTDPTKLLGGNTGFIAGDFGVSDTIVLDKGWAELLNAPQVIADDAFNTTEPAIPLLLSRFTDDFTGGDDHDYESFFAIRSNTTKDSYYANITNTIEILLSTLVADGISRGNGIPFGLWLELSQKWSNGTSTLDNILMQAGSWDMSPFYDLSVSDINTLDQIEFTVQRYGWGYGLNPPTAKFAVAVLLAYVAMLFLFQIMCLIFLISRRGWTSRAWGNVGELVALAAMSRESEALQNTGAGIDKGETWMVPVRIREREGRRVEITFGDTDKSLMEAHGLLKVEEDYH
jgi:hypothetical protein